MLTAKDIMTTSVVTISDILNKSDFVEKPKSNFELYCEENPSAPEARIYED